MNPVIINLWYVVAAALFIFGLKQLGSPCDSCAWKHPLFIGHGNRHRRNPFQ